MINEKLIDAALAAIKEERELTRTMRKPRRYMVNCSAALGDRIEKAAKKHKIAWAKLILGCIKIALPVLEEEDGVYNR